MSLEPKPTTRLAPSPTGSLHLGNARTFLVNWALARQRGWRVVMRMEDLDGPRVKPGSSDQALAVLDWLGLDWDGPVLHQSADLTPYREALERLRSRGLIYRCTCTRKDIAAAQSAPQEESHELRYPGTCRPDGDGKSDNPGDPLLCEDDAAWRLRVPAEELAFEDELLGPQRVNVQREVGDFVIASKAGLPAYQLAVVVDDARQGVTHVVRGDDLLSSTARQLWLYDLLALSPRPRYFHLPLVLGPDGRRLAKRHGDTRLTSYQERGIDAKRIVGLIASWCGIVNRPTPMNAETFARSFDLTALPRDPITVSSAELAWLEETQEPIQ